jgi:hypothetical protein
MPMASVDIWKTVIIVDVKIWIKVPTFVKPIYPTTMIIIDPMSPVPNPGTITVT